MLKCWLYVSALHFDALSDIIISSEGDDFVIDTHCHLNIEDFDQDLEKVIEHAFHEGVQSMIVIGIDDETNKKALKIVDTYEELYATVGIHPSDADEGDVQSIIPYIEHPKVVAVGECGIDLHWRKDNLEKQLEVFDEQIKIAIAHDLPLVIHTRDSFEEAYQAVLPYKGKVRGVFHCFSSNVDDALKAIELGFYVGLDGPVTFKNGRDALVIAKEIPLEWLLIETDSPYLAPTPYRGKRNEPAYLPLIAKAIARLRNISEEEVVRQTTKNAKHLFKLGD